MTKLKISETKSAYEDSQVVAGYVAEHGSKPKMLEAVGAFAKTLPGEKVIDVGCGPGQDSWHFAKLGFDVVGVDFSSEMIKAAGSLDKADKPPRFMVGDMRELAELFPEDSFDGAWVCASLLHIEREEVPAVLSGLKKIVVDGGRIYIGVKGGEGEELREEDKYGPKMKRKFVYWQEDELQRVLERAGFEVVKLDEQEGGGSTWLNFYLRNKKDN